MASLVIIYGLLIFVDATVMGVLADQDDARPPGTPAVLTIEMRRRIRNIFWVTDFAFLSFFLFEALLWFFALSTQLVRSKLHVADTSLLVVTFAFSLSVAPFVWEAQAQAQQDLEVAGEYAAAATAAAIDQDTFASLSIATQCFRITRLIRLFRLFPVIMKVQERNASAALDRKTRDYGNSGSNVERVLMILKRLKRTEFDSIKEREKINYIMEMIVFDQLYSVNVSDLTKEQEEFLNSQGASLAHAHKERCVHAQSRTRGRVAVDLLRNS